MIDEATVDCYNESEQAMGLFTMIEERLSLPFPTTILGAQVTVEAVRQNDAGEIVAVCTRGRDRQNIPVVDLPLPSPRPKPVDTLRIWQFPVVLGTGKRLFGEGMVPRSFRLVDTQLNTTGAVLHVYERAGGLKYGEVEVGQETVIFDSSVTHE